MLTPNLPDFTGPNTGFTIYEHAYLDDHSSPIAFFLLFYDNLIDY